MDGRARTQVLQNKAIRQEKTKHDAISTKGMLRSHIHYFKDFKLVKLRVDAPPEEF